MTEENNNTLSAEGITVNPEAKQAINEHKNLRAFFVSYAANAEEAKAISEGRMAPSRFVPLYAESEQVAAAFLHDQIQNGMIVLSFEPLEVLEMKTFMLRNIAEKNGINIQRQKMFDGRLLLLEHNPIQLYDASSQQVEQEQETVEENPQN